MSTITYRLVGAVGELKGRAYRYAGPSDHRGLVTGRIADG